MCNKREKRKGNNTVAKDTNSAAGKLPLYPLEMKQRWNLRFKPVFMLSLPSGSSRRFEGTYRLHVQSYESVSWLITLMMKTVNFFQTSVTNYLNTGRINPEYLLSLLKHRAHQSRILAIATVTWRMPAAENIFVPDYFIFVIHCVLSKRD